MNMIENEYRFNVNFRKFVDEYCDKNRITVEEAFNDAFVKHMFWRYTDV